MLKKIFELVFLMCLTGGLLYAGEVALVTDLSGDVTASWLEPVAGEDKTAGEERGRHEWKVELAEMLPAGADIKTASESSLTIVHLTGNVEYRVAADSVARITEEGVEGEKVASSPMMLVSTNIGLDGTMQHQVGAVVADQEHRETIGGADSYDGNKSVSDDVGASQDNETAMQGLSNAIGANLEEQKKKLEISMPPAPVPPPAPIKRTPQPEESYKHVLTDTSLGASARYKEEANVETGFALPQEMFAEVCSNQENISVEGYEVKFVEEHDGWVNIRFNASVIDQDFELQIKGDKASRPITLHVEKDSESSIALAWRLEKSGLLAQAASVWLQLQAGGMDTVKVAVHLKRIRNKLLAG